MSKLDEVAPFVADPSQLNGVIMELMTLKLELWQIKNWQNQKLVCDGTLLVTKLKKGTCDKSKIEIVTKFNYPNCDKTQKP